ncbi:MAG TPA: phospho-N-acetylmuramoyl-pentapeptide-transferase, partial [Dongiaceae bacterium]
MLYNLLAPYAGETIIFNLFRYLTFRSGGAVVTALAISFVLGAPIIRWLKRKQREGQPIRSDGPESHLITKKGTPTMGGVLILLAVTLSTLLWADLRNGFVWVVLFVTVGFGAIGFADDYLKLTRRNSKGLPGRRKLIGQFAISFLAAFVIMRLTPAPLSDILAIPFIKTPLHLSWFYLPLAAVVMVGASNAVNLTDGLDGLAIGPIMLAAGCFALIAYLAGNSVFATYLQINYIPGSGELAVL